MSTINYSMQYAVRDEDESDDALMARRGRHELTFISAEGETAIKGWLAPLAEVEGDVATAAA